MKFYRFYKTEETFDFPTLVLDIAIFCETFSIFFEWLHLLIYAENGVGSFVLDLLSQAFGTFSQFTMTLLLILIASGWSIDFHRFDELDLYLPLTIMVGIFHIVIVGVGRINDEDPTKFHDYENIPGYIIMSFIMIFYALFAYFVYSTYHKPDSSSDRRNFYKRFSVFGTIYLLALPLIVFISSVFVAPYVRNKVIILGTLAIQIGTMITLTYLLGSKKSKYNQVSLKGKTLLMSGKLD